MRERVEAGPATADLRRDHREALAILDRLDAAAAALPERGPVPLGARGAIDRAAAFIATDLPLHFRREDDVLFPSLDLPRDAGPLAQMAYEHEVLGEICGRAFPAAYAELTASPGPGPASIRAFRRVVADLGSVLRDHIAKEDEILFPLADRQLAAADASGLAARMGEIREAGWQLAPGGASRGGSGR